MLISIPESRRAPLSSSVVPQGCSGLSVGVSKLLGSRQFGSILEAWSVYLRLLGLAWVQGGGDITPIGWVEPVLWEEGGRTSRGGELW